MKKPDRLVKRNAQQVCTTLTGDAELFFLGLQTLAELLVVVVLLVAAVLSVVAVLLVEVVVELSAEAVVEFEQGPLKGSVFGCVPFMTVLSRAGSKNAVLLFAGSWA
jgi:hypothetical protein